MGALLKSLDGAGPYISVFICMVIAITFFARERKRILAALDRSNERLLDEREKRAVEGLETARLLSASTHKVAEHTKLLDKVYDRWMLRSSPT